MDTGWYTAGFLVVLVTLVTACGCTRQMEISDFASEIRVPIAMRGRNVSAMYCGDGDIIGARIDTTYRTRIFKFFREDPINGYEYHEVIS